jgi:hypothetical protein
MTDYSKGKIYKIVDNTTGNIYIGSTTKELNERLSGHYYDYKKCLAGKETGYVTSFEILKNGDYYIELIEDCPSHNRSELEERERYYIENNKCVNKTIPGRTDREYCEARRDIKRAYDKEYYDAKRETLLNNAKQYYELNKDKIRKTKYSLCYCPCGYQFTRSNYRRHIKSKHHFAYLNNPNITTNIQAVNNYKQAMSNIEDIEVDKLKQIMCQFIKA